MFLEKINWKDPRYFKWNLSNLGPLNQAQLDAFFDDDKIDFPDFTEDELKEMSLKIPCRVELFHSNVCHGVERSWPHGIFRRPSFRDLLPHQKRILIRTMVRDGVKLYNKYVDEERLKRRRMNRTFCALAPYFTERYLKHRFERIKALGTDESDTESVCSVTTVIDTSQYNSMTDVPTIGQNTSNVNRSDAKINAALTGNETKIEIDNSSDDEYESSSTLLDEVRRVHEQHASKYNKSPSSGDSSDRDFEVPLLVEIPGQNLISVARRESIEQIVVSDDSDSDVGVPVTEERFNETITDTIEIETVSISHCNSNESQLFSTPRINSSELLPISTVDMCRFRASYEEGLDLLLSPIHQLQSSFRDQAPSQNIIL